jgi:hypothetical protein
MAQPTKNDTALGMANQLISLCGQLKAASDAFTAFNQRNTDLSPDTFWRQMATAAVNADGSIGAADGAVNLAHPITVGGLNRAESDLLPGLTLALEFVAFLNGTLATNRAQVNRLTVIDTLVG